MEFNNKMAAAPYVNAKNFITQQINSTPTLIFGNDQHTCLIQQVLFVNLSEVNEININLYILKEIDNIPQEITIANNIKVLDSLIYENIPLIFEPGDLLFAYSFQYGSIFNTEVSYLELTEQPPITVIPIPD